MSKRKKADTGHSQGTTLNAGHAPQVSISINSDLLLDRGGADNSGR